MALKVITFNARSVLSQRTDLMRFLQSHQVDVLLLQETFLKPGHRFSIPNYQVVRFHWAHQGGTAIIIRSSLVFDKLQSLPTPYLQTTGVRIRTLNASVIIYSMH